MRENFEKTKNAIKMMKCTFNI